MKNSKITFVLMALIVLTFSVFLWSCEKEQPQNSDKLKGLSEKIENKTEAYKTDIFDSMASLTSNDKMKSYLFNWAETKGIRVKEDDGILVMNVDGSIEYKDAPPTVILCPYDVNNLNTIDPIIMTMYALKNNEETGRLTALFVPENGHDMQSYSKLKKKYFKKNSNVICLNGDTKAIVSEAAGGASTYRFTKKLHTSAPKNLVAYRIEIKGIGRNQIDNQINMKINPIVEANTLLANLKKSSIDYEIISITGGSRDSLYPGSCVMKITVDEDRQALVEKRLDSRIASFNKRKKSLDPDAVYEYTKIETPDRVITQADSAKLVAFIYTLLEDEYYRDEDNDMLVAVCDTSFIRTKKGKVTIGSTAYSLDASKLTEIDEASETLCGLSGFKYKKATDVPVWSSQKESDLTTRIRSAYSKYTGKDLIVQPSISPSSAGYVEALNDKCNIISITASESTMKDFTGTIMRYLIKLNEESK